MENTEEKSEPEVKVEEKKVEEETKNEPKPIETPKITDELLAKIVNLCEKQSDTIQNLNKKLSELEEKHNTLNTDYENRKPINIRGEVMGLYDFNKNKEIQIHESYETEKRHARSIKDKLDMLYPSA